MTGKLEFCFIKLRLVPKFVSVCMWMQSATFPLKTKHNSETNPPERVHSGCTPQERARTLWRAFTNWTGVGKLVFHIWEKAKAFLLAWSLLPYILHLEKLFCQILVNWHFSVWMLQQIDIFRQKKICQKTPNVLQLSAQITFSVQFIIV